MPCFARVSLPCLLEGDGGRCTAIGGEDSSSVDGALESVEGKAGDAGEMMRVAGDRGAEVGCPGDSDPGDGCTGVPGRDSAFVETERPGETGAGIPCKAGSRVPCRAGWEAGGALGLASGG
jgi:hypothetical protein